MSGYVVNTPQPHPAYAVSKAAVHHLARSLAGEWVGHKIRVNSISPGIMNTRLSGGPAQAELRKLWLQKSPMGIGDPEDLTGAAILLCSEAGRFITGTDIKLDGKRTRLTECHTDPDILQADIRCSKRITMQSHEDCNDIPHATTGRYCSFHTQIMRFRLGRKILWLSIYSQVLKL